MIAAALMHDIGHLVHDLGENPAAKGVDDQHEDVGVGDGIEPVWGFQYKHEVSSFILGKKKPYIFM